MHRDFKELLSAFNEGHVKYQKGPGYWRAVACRFGAGSLKSFCTMPSTCREASAICFSSASKAARVLRCLHNEFNSRCSSCATFRMGALTT
jgi:hypothetical protein